MAYKIAVTNRSAFDKSEGMNGAKPNGYFWKGANGQVWVQGDNGIHSAGNWDNNTINYWRNRGFMHTDDSPQQTSSTGTPGTTRTPGTTGTTGTTRSSATTHPLDTAQIDSLQSFLSSLDTIRNLAGRKAQLTRDANLNAKQDELKQQTDTYNNDNLSNDQQFATSKNKTDQNTRDTLSNLLSSLSTLNMGGGADLQRQILAAANQSNQDANSTQATNARKIAAAYNDYKAGYDQDVQKINDQYNYDLGAANKSWGQNRQNALYKIADLYNTADQTAQRNNFMNQGNDLNSYVATAPFTNPSYTGVKRTMDTPDVGSFIKDVANYDTSSIGANAPVGGTNITGGTAPVSVAPTDPTTSPASTPSIQANPITLTDTSNLTNPTLGVQKKTEGQLGYGI